MGIYSPTVSTLPQAGVEVQTNSGYEQAQQSVGQGYIYSLKQLQIISQTTNQLLEPKSFITYDKQGNQAAQILYNPANPEQKIKTVTQYFENPFNFDGNSALQLGLYTGEDTVFIFFCDETKTADALTRSESLVDQIAGSEHFPMFQGFTDEPIDWRLEDEEN